MNVPREVVFERLFSLFAPLQCAAGAAPTQIQPFVTVSRILPPIANISPDMQPALFCLEEPETDDEQTWGAERYILKAKLICIAWIPDTNTTIPGQKLNPLIDAFDYAMRSPYGTAQPIIVNEKGWAVASNPLWNGGQGIVTQTLGGVVENAWIVGVKRQSGHVGNQNWAVASINIMTGE